MIWRLFAGPAWRGFHLAMAWLIISSVSHYSNYQFSLIKAAIALLMAVLCAACDRTTVVDLRANSAVGDTAQVVAGSLGDTDIFLGDVEYWAGMPLYDLELQRYLLLRQTLESEVLERIDAGFDDRRQADIRLQPPLPPRLEVEPDRARLRPAGSKPVTVLAFCNMESPHCTRLQLLLSRVLPLFGDVVQFATRDLILPFHRHAALAAEAGHCAVEQDRYWAYHEFMYADSSTPDRQRVDRAARAAQLDAGLFEHCLDSGRNRDKVTADGELARVLGVDKLPAVFVNGLYAGTNPQAGQLIWLIEHELGRLGVDSPRHSPPQRSSAQAYELQAVLYSDQPGQGLVMLASGSVPGRVDSFREGDAVETHLILRRITREGVEFLNHQVSESLGFVSRTVLEPSRDPAVPEVVQEPLQDDVAALAGAHRGIPVTLDRTEVLIRLADVTELEQALVTVPMTAGGYHLLRIAEIESGGLYELLGLMPGDVVVLVNEEPLHEGSNPLWNALQSEDEVRLRVMRKGAMVSHLTYRFDD
jgi:protein-disulfide isomerase/type II secretory pathway component PulC